MSLPWLEQPLARILDVHQQGRLPHALLIRASEGWGEVALASALALKLLGRADADTDPKQLAHPDLRWVQAEGSVIKVEDIRALAAFAVGTRQSAPCKVAVVEAAELMNRNAANALLKTLEEPPADTYLLLTTSRASRLLPTIVSRCQAVTIERDAAAAVSWLEVRWPAEAVAAKLRDCGGAPLTVDAALAAEEPSLAGLLKRLEAPAPVSGAVAELLGVDVDRLTAAWYRHCIDLLARDPAAGSAPDRQALAGFVDELTHVRHQLLTTNSANQRLLYERLAAGWRGLVRDR